MATRERTGAGECSMMYTLQSGPIFPVEESKERETIAQVKKDRETIAQVKKKRQENVRRGRSLPQ